MKHSRFFCATILSGVLPFALFSTSAHAQAWIGAIVGQAAAEQEEAAREKACIAGQPAEPEDVERANTRIERTMVAYFELTPDSKASDITDLFTSRFDDLRWSDEKGDVPITALAPRLNIHPQQRTLIALIVGGDDQSARAIWSVTPSVGATPIFYAGDFVNQGWLGGWRIWHVAVSSTAPDTPPAYCHFNPEDSF